MMIVIVIVIGMWLMKVNIKNPKSYFRVVDKSCMDRTKRIISSMIGLGVLALLSIISNRFQQGEEMLREALQLWGNAFSNKILNYHSFCHDIIIILIIVMIIFRKNQLMILQFL
jgi:hypothetical protein